MDHQAELMFAAARAFLHAWDWLGPEVLGDCEPDAVDALRALVESRNDDGLAGMVPVNLLPL